MSKPLRLSLILSAVGIAFAAVWYMYSTGPQAREKVWADQPLRRVPVGTTVYSPDFAEPTSSALALWNTAASAEVFVPGGGLDADVLVLSDTGTPCGSAWRPEEEWSHAATAYQCPDGTWQVLVSAPGDIHDQYCIVAHELGHVLGLMHDDRGVMAQGCAALVRVNDKDREAIKERYGAHP